MLLQHVLLLHVTFMSSLSNAVNNDDDVNDDGRAEYQKKIMPELSRNSQSSYNKRQPISVKQNFKKKISGQLQWLLLSP